MEQPACGCLFYGFSGVFVIPFQAAVDFFPSLRVPTRSDHLDHRISKGALKNQGPEGFYEYRSLLRAITPHGRYSGRTLGMCC